MIGKVALENPDLPIEFIRDTLAAKKQGDFEPFELGLSYKVYTKDGIERVVPLTEMSLTM
jgi:hypothetical protein